MDETNSRDTGGPAFPRDHQHDGHNGMTLRDYFIAHAPDVPPWFVPKVPPRPSPFITPPDITPEEREEWSQVLEWGEGAELPRVKQWEEERIRSNAAREMHADLVQREKTLQWPGFWADEQIARRRA